MKTVKIPFNVEKAKNGATVVTRNDKPVRIVCYDVKSDEYPILALVTTDRGEIHYSYATNGKYHIGESGLDLFISESIIEFEVFDKVLVRDNPDAPWRAEMFCFLGPEDEAYPFHTLGSAYKYCIPYEGNEHLLNKIN